MKRAVLSRAVDVLCRASGQQSATTTTTTTTRCRERWARLIFRTRAGESELWWKLKVERASLGEEREGSTGGRYYQCCLWLASSAERAGTSQRRAAWAHGASAGSQRFCSHRAAGTTGTSDWSIRRPWHRGRFGPTPQLSIRVTAFARTAI
jgi:hypothetical protein